MDSMHFLLHETFGKPCLLSLVLCHHLCIRDSTKPLAGICIVSTTCSYMCPRKTKLLYSTRSGQKLHRIPLINRSQQATVVHSKGLHSVGLHSVGLHGESTWIHSGITFTGTLTWALEYNFGIQPDSGCLSDVHYFELSVPMKISSPQQACGISKSCKMGDLQERHRGSTPTRHWLLVCLIDILSLLWRISWRKQSWVFCFSKCN